MSDWMVVETFATKGAEYLLVIVFLVSLALFWRLLVRPAAVVAPAPAAPRAGRAGWFSVPGDRLFHPGHAWAAPAGSGEVTIGVDDFAQRLLGPVERISLPAVGSRLEQGEPGWSMAIDSKSIAMLAPVGGEVVARNEAVLRDPRLLNREPYGSGWLLRVRTPRERHGLRSLLSGRFARAWMQATEDELRRISSGELGLVLQDGGTPVSGIARAVSPEGWELLARDFLRSD